MSLKSLKDTIKISLKSYDKVVLNQVTQEIISTVKKTGAVVKGPIPIPTKIKKFTVIRSPHVNKSSREQFEIRSLKRLLIIIPTEQTIDSLMNLSVSSGVNVDIAT